jgi:hypothetical protein
MEKLAGRLQRVILASSEFARHSGGEFAALGDFTFGGFSAPQQIFGPANQSQSEEQGRVQPDHSADRDRHADDAGRCCRERASIARGGRGSSSASSDAPPCITIA